MKNFKKQLENQQKINEAVNAIINHFKDEASYCDHYRTMSEAQTIIMELTELNLAQAAGGRAHVPIKELYEFVFEVNEIYKLLKPFAEMIGQVYGNED